ncbi:hypothetical protein MMC26_003261 [Xylographa opegraphella]|nr:hypothetical protein [Xylographa opegraphella]
MVPGALVADPARGNLTKQRSVKQDDTTTTAPAPEPQPETPLQAICYGGTLPGIPTHPTFTAHRLWALSHMTALFRHWARHNYSEGMSGHISVRDPEYPSLFWTNPLAVHFGLLRASDMLLVSDAATGPLAGRILAGNRLMRPANRAGWAIHAAVHRRRADVNAVCHAHTRYGKVWAASGRGRLQMVDQDVCNFYGEALAVYEDYGGVVLGQGAGAEGEAMARALGPRGKGLVLASHGLLTVGGTVDEAGFLFGALERSCAVQVALAGMGGPRAVIGEREAEFNFRMASTPETLYWEFQPDYDYELAMSHDRFVDVTEEDLAVWL